MVMCVGGILRDGLPHKKRQEVVIGGLLYFLMQLVMLENVIHIKEEENPPQVKLCL